MDDARLDVGEEEREKRRERPGSHHRCLHWGVSLGTKEAKGPARMEKKGRDAGWYGEDGRVNTYIYGGEKREGRQWREREREA